jgi:hypothetical protein
MVLDRKALRSGGATALTRRGGGFEVTPARPDGLDRPWARSQPAVRTTRPPAAAAEQATPLAPDIDAEE